MTSTGNLRPRRVSGCDCRSYSGAAAPNRAAAAAYCGRSRGVPGAHSKGTSPHDCEREHPGRSRRIARASGSRRSGPLGCNAKGSELRVSTMAGHRRGDGTVYLPKGRSIWKFSYFVNGRRIIVSSGSTDEAEARRQLRVKVGEKAAGRAVMPGRATVADLCALVIDDYRIRELRDAKAVTWRYKAHIERLLGHLPASRFGSAQVTAVHSPAAS
jgi:hypothetical protein